MNSHYGSLSHGRRVIMTRRCFLVEPGIYFSKFLPIDPSSVLGNHVKLSFLLLLHSSLSDPWWPRSFNSPSFSLILLSPPRLSDHFNVSTTFRSLSSRYSPLIFQTYNSPPKMWCVCMCVCVCVCVCVKSLQLCLTLCNPMDCSPPGSSVHGILQAKILEWAATSSSRGSSQPRHKIGVS